MPDHLGESAPCHHPDLLNLTIYWKEGYTVIFKQLFHILDAKVVKNNKDYYLECDKPNHVLKCD